MTDEKPLFEEHADDDLLFADEDGGKDASVGHTSWKLMIVDDHEDVHNMTRLVLSDFTFEGRSLDFLSAYTGAEAKVLIEQHPDTAVILLDVVMEDNQAGINVAKYIRSDLGNRLTRIILRTGQPGQAPERKVVTELDINDYKQKTELTAQRLFTTVTTAIRSYRDLLVIEEGRKSMHLLALSVAHQVRNRTVAIAGFANILLRKSQEDEALREYIETILSESSRLEEMVAAVNSYAAIHAPEMEQILVADAFAKARIRADIRAEEQGKTIQWVENVEALEVEADPGQLVELLGALLDNAVDFTEETEVYAAISIRSDAGGCRLEVEDKGMGISREDMPHVFDPFFTQKPHSAGMGLSVARRVADEHQWEVLISSTVGEGTCVDVFMPTRCTICRIPEEESD